MLLLLILWFLMSLDLSLGKKGYLSFPWQACRLLLVLFNSPKLHAFLFLALRLEPNEMPLTNIPSWFPARANVGSFMPLDFRRLIGISRPPDSSGIKSHFSNLSIWGWTRRKKKLKQMNKGEGLGWGRMEKVVAGVAENGGGLKKTESWHGVNPSDIQVAFTPEPLCFVPKQIICSKSICIFPSSHFLFTKQ